MPGQYIYPLTSYFTGGTVSGETVFLAGVTANTLSTENFLVSGSTLEQIIQELIDYSSFSGGTIVGDTYFANGLSAGTFSVEGNVTPFYDNVSSLGIPTNRWSELNIVNGVAENLTATTYYSGSTLVDSLFARTIHTHEVADVNGLQTNLDSKADLTGATFIGGIFSPELSATTLYSGTTLVDSLFARTIHTHAIADVNGLQTNIDGKADLTGATFTGGVSIPELSATTLYSGSTLVDSLFARTVHTHEISDVNGLQSQLDSKASASGLTDYIKLDGSSSATTGNILFGNDTGIQFGAIPLNTGLFGSDTGDNNTYVKLSSTNTSTSDNSYIQLNPNSLNLGSLNVGIGLNVFTGNSINLLMNSKNSVLKNDLLTDDRIFNFPDEDGTFALKSDTYQLGAGLSNSAGTAYVNYENSPYKKVVRIATTASLLPVTYSNGSSGVGATITRIGNVQFPVIDGVQLVVGERILIKNQTSNFQNGIYILTDEGLNSVRPYVLTRDTDSDSSWEVYQSTFSIREGSLNAGTIWMNSNIDSNISIGTDSIVFEQVGGYHSTNNIFTGSNSFGLLSATTLYSGSTNVDSLFARTVHTHVIADVTGLQNQLNGKVDITGDTFTGGVFAPTLSATTLYSGSTNLSSIITSIVTGVTLQGNYLSLDGGTVTGNTLFSANLSAATLYSGSTNIDSLFAHTIHSHVISDVIGLQTQLVGKADLTGATFTGGVFAPAVSATTLYSGSTLLDSLFARTVHTHTVADVTGLQTQLNNKADLTGATFTGNVRIPVFTATTLYSGATLVDSLFARTVHTHAISDVTGLQSQLTGKADLTGATFTGGVFAPAVSATTLYSGSTNLSVIINSLITGGTLQGNYLSIGGGTVTGNTSFSANLSAATYYSGTTLLDSLFARTVHTHVISDVTGLQAQLTGKANLTGATFTGIVFAPTVSATTFYSGATLVDSLFARTVHSHVINDVAGLQAQLNNKADLTGATFTGNVRVPVFTATTLYSGATLVDSLFARTVHTHVISDVTGLQAQLNNKADLTGATFTGNVRVPVFTATTYYSGTTLLDSIFARTVHTHAIADVNGLQTQLNGKADLTGATFGGIVSAPGFIDSTLTNTRVVYAGPSGRLVDSSAFTFNAGTLVAPNISSGSLIVGTGGAIVGAGGVGDLVVHGNLTVYGQAVSAFTTNLFIEDNNITVNYNSSGSSISSSLGAGFTIQDGSGVQGTDVFLDIRGAALGLSNRSLSTNIEDIRIRETGTVSAPNGVRLLAEGDVLDGGQF